MNPKEIRSNMGYELLADVQTVVLGGTDKNGKRNPTQLEGFFLRTESRPNRFNPGKPQNFYVFQTETGEVGVYGKAGLDREMKKAKIGAMTKVVNTGKKLDTGKGQPMTIFEVYQDKTNAIKVEEIISTAQTVSSQDLSEDGAAWADEATEDSFDDEEPMDVAPAPRAVAPQRTATPPSAAQQAKLQAVLNRNRRTG